MMQQHIRGDAAFARPFDAIHDIEFDRKNILTSASFSSSAPPALPPLPPLPALKKGLKHVVRIWVQEGKP
ncbi:hypothetical protein [Pantoea sp. R102]|uniref:hypothetical protein n=1 Tax=Pantoea sp. R102 TaxID=2507583 RepID=UPI0010A8FA47|nr:hypothetical protein [Pantoea sp. R102]THD40231.1 hypothetical protein ERD80_05335 [Pantoea sp. R102]